MAKFTISVVVRESRTTRIEMEVESEYPQIHDVMRLTQYQPVEAVMAGREVEWEATKQEIEGVYLVAENGVRL